MDNFDLRKYLAENKLLKESLGSDPKYYVKYTTQDGETAKSGLMSKREAIYKERDLVDSGVKKSSVYKLIKNIDLNGKPYVIDSELDKEIDYRKDEKGRPIDENKLIKENTNPIWVIDSFEDNADISDAGSEYKTAVINTIKAKHPNISSEDLEKSIEVTNDFWYDEARKNSKGSDPEEIEVSAEDFANSAIEYYEDIIMYDGDKDEDSSPGYQSFDDYIKGEKESGNY